jgi:hypothetical protein
VFTNFSDRFLYRTTDRVTYSHNIHTKQYSPYRQLAQYSHQTIFTVPSTHTIFTPTKLYSPYRQLTPNCIPRTVNSHNIHTKLYSPYRQFTPNCIHRTVNSHNIHTKLYSPYRQFTQYSHQTEFTVPSTRTIFTP